MANYLMRYKGIYRLKAHVDQSTNDFPRDLNGVIDSDDYISNVLLTARFILMVEVF